MIVLFVAGAMSLLWMGALAVVIFVEKVEARRMLASRAIGVLLVALGAFVAVRTYLGA
jgi:predicted metal-binding membrane protein